MIIQIQKMFFPELILLAGFVIFCGTVKIPVFVNTQTVLKRLAGKLDKEISKAKTDESKIV